MRKSKKQILALFSSVAVLFSTLNVPVYADTKEVNNDKENVVAKEKEVKDGSMSISYGSGENGDYSGYLGEPEWFANYETNENDYELLTNTAIPSKYSSVDAGYITEIKDQNPYGTCWAFATIASSEASLIREGLLSKDTADLSEYHLAYFTFHPTGDPLGGTKGDIGCLGTKAPNYLNHGGNYSMSTETLATWMGVAAEDTADYDDCDPNSVLNNSFAYTKNVAHLENTELIPTSDRNAVKSKIMEYGAGGLSYYDNSTYLAEDNVSYYNYSSTSTNHAVTVVGWDDSYPATNFKKTAPGNGAWLIKNSWGTWFGNKGYFWISYYDTSIDDSITFFDYGSKDNYDKNYQYDGTIALGTSWWYNSNNKVTGANTFVAKEDENLKAVSFYTYYDLNVDYSIQVYTGLSATGNPTSGTKAYTTPVTGKVAYPGYHTIKLSKPVSLKKGERYAIVLTLSLDHESIAYGDYMCFPIERSETVTEDGQSVSTSSAQRYQSYILRSDVWTDVKDLSISNSNLKIKAFTDLKNGVVDVKLNTQPTKTTFYQYDEDLDLSGLTVKVSYEDGTSKVITPDLSNADLSTKVAGTKKVEFECYGYLLSVNVNIVPVSGIQIQNSSITINKGQSLEEATYNVYYTYSGTTKLVPANKGYMFSSEYDSIKNTIGTHYNVTVNYLAEDLNIYVAVISVVVKDKVLKGINITAPKRTTYYYNVKETISLDGMTVTGVYTDNTTVALTSGYKVASTVNFAKSGYQDVTVDYKGLKATFSIYVDPGFYMQLVKFPSYVNKGAALTSGMFNMKIHFTDEKTATVPFSSCKVSGYNKDKTGIQKVTITYGTNAVSFEIRVVSLSKPTVKAQAYNKVKISWTCTPQCTGYDVYRAKAGSSSYTKVGTAKSGNEYFYDTTVAVGQAYTYKVKPAIGYDVFKGSTFAVSPASASVKTSMTAPKITAGKSLAYNQNKIAWSKVTGAQGYLVYRKTAKTGYSLVGTITSGSTVTFTDKKAVTGTTYYYVVKSYRTVSGKKVPSAKSAAKAIKTTLPTTRIYSAVVSKSSVQVKWNKVTGASGYEVYMATSATGKYVKKATVSSSKLSYKVSGLTKNKNYYFKVKAYRTVNGKKVYSTASSAVKFTTLKR